MTVWSVIEREIIAIIRGKGRMEERKEKGVSARLVDYDIKGTRLITGASHFVFLHHVHKGETTKALNSDLQ